MSNRILLVEDDQSFGAVLKDYLTINNFEVTLATDGEQGLKEFTENEFDICIFDVMMPKKDGFSLAEDVKKLIKIHRSFPYSKKYERRYLERISVGS
jgi:DNA-binding response OmpR family regulator